MQRQNPKNKKRMCKTENCDMVAQIGVYCGRCKKNGEHECSKHAKKSGVVNGKQKYACTQCGKRW
jgi:transposase-like protein